MGNNGEYSLDCLFPVWCLSMNYDMAAHGDGEVYHSDLTY